MPVNEKQSVGEKLYQREQYAKGGLGRIYWDYRDKVILSMLDNNDCKVLDAGCGEGITLEKICKIFPNYTVTGIDNIPENVEICRKHGLRVEPGDIFNMRFANEEFDTVLFIEVIDVTPFFVPLIMLVQLVGIVKAEKRL